jgi:N-acetylneuraminate lyase
MRYGIGGLYLTGSTGEGFMMTEAERMALVEAVLAETRGEIPVIVHVGAISTRASERLARHAASAGADAISSVPPIYWKFTAASVAGYYGDLVQAAGLPMIVYNIALAGLVRFDMVKRLARSTAWRASVHRRHPLRPVPDQGGAGRDFMSTPARTKWP